VAAQPAWQQQQPTPRPHAQRAKQHHHRLLLLHLFQRHLLLLGVAARQLC
jgi:hypothetical protein